MIPENRAVPVDADDQTSRRRLSWQAPKLTEYGSIEKLTQDGGSGCSGVQFTGPLDPLPLREGS